MGFIEKNREYWEEKPNSSDFLRVVDSCLNSKPYKGKPVRYGKERIIVDGPYEALCWFWMKGNVCIVEPRVKAMASQELKSYLSRAGFEVTDHEGRPTIDICVTIEHVNDPETWNSLESALEDCASRA